MKNLFRYKRRTFITAIAIALGLAMFLIVDSLLLGMMRALGMKESRIMLSFLFEAGGIGMIGALIGLALGAMGNLYMVNIGIDFGFIMRDTDLGYRIQSIVRGSWNLRSFIITFVSGITLSIIVAYLPIRRALKKDIPACLRH